MPEGNQRRLAAILVADVVGYSRLMEADEAGTLAALKERRKSILDPTVREHSGRIVKLMGDGVLVEFASAVKAVEAGKELQRRMDQANEPLPEGRRLVLRIGINLGDVIGQGSDIYGDGVNVAARLEALSEPGGICISSKVHDEVRGKVEVGWVDLGDKALKNITMPVRVFQSASRTQFPASLADSATASIAVLPFVNMSHSEERYLADGLTEDIITELTRFRELRVSSRSSCFRYRGPDVDIVRAARELNVEYLVEGSVRRVGERVRITTQLINAQTGAHVWAERFDRGRDDIFDVQDHVVRTIVGSLLGRVKGAALGEALRKPPGSLAAYECVLRADALPFEQPEARAEARRLFERAIELDPGYGRAYALLSNLHRVEWLDDRSDSHALRDRALHLAKTGVALDERDTVCQQALGWILGDSRSYEMAEFHVRKALELTPNQPTAWTSLAWLYRQLGKPGDAIQYFEEARVVDPHFEPPWFWSAFGGAYFQLRQYPVASAHFSRSTRMPYWTEAYLAASRALEGDADKAAQAAAGVLRKRPDFSARWLARKEGYKNAADEEHLMEGLLKAGLPE